MDYIGVKLSRSTHLKNSVPKPSAGKNLEFFIKILPQDYHWSEILSLNFDLKLSIHNKAFNDIRFWDSLSSRYKSLKIFPLFYRVLYPSKILYLAEELS